VGRHGRRDGHCAARHVRLGGDGAAAAAARLAPADDANDAVGDEDDDAHEGAAGRDEADAHADLLAHAQAEAAGVAARGAEGCDVGIGGGAHRDGEAAPGAAGLRRAGGGGVAERAHARRGGDGAPQRAVHVADGTHRSAARVVVPARVQEPRSRVHHHANALQLVVLRARVGAGAVGPAAVAAAGGAAAAAAAAGTRAAGAVAGRHLARPRLHALGHELRQTRVEADGLRAGAVRDGPRGRARQHRAARGVEGPQRGVRADACGGLHRRRVAVLHPNNHGQREKGRGSE